MNVDDTVASPLGDLRFTVTVGTSESPPEAASTHVRGGKVRFEWKHVDGAAISLLRVPLPVSRGPSAVVGWGLLWTITATRNLGPIRVDMLLSANLEGERWGDELEHQIQFVDANWQLTMGGVDDEALLAAASTGILPRDWVAPLRTGVFGVDASCAQRLGYLFPSLTSGQQFRLACAVAWSSSDDEYDDETSAAIDILILDAYNGFDA